MSLKFLGFTLNPERCSLLTADREIKLRPKTFDVLHLLIQNAGRLIRREELISTVWPDVIVNEESVTQCVSELRQALEDREHKIIKTIARRGYLCTVPVEQITDDYEADKSLRGPLSVSASSSLHAIGLKGHQAVVLPVIAQFGGCIIDTAGDGILAEFGSVANAVECAIAIQETMAERNASISQTRRMQYRIGVNLGDIIYDEHQIYGDSTNIAARLEGIAEPGGIYISRHAYDQVDGKLAASFQKLGPQALKNIATPVEIFAVHGTTASRKASSLDFANLQQEIKYCRARDGVRLAYAIAGSGPPLVKAANWLNHLEYDWESPVWRHTFRGLASDHTLIRYDARGNGMSDWDVNDLSLDTWVRDLETVVDAAGVERFPLLGISQGCAVSIAYAVRHPERVSHLILYGGFALGQAKRSPDEKDAREAMTTLMRLGWGADNPAFRQMFTAQFMPGATQQQADYFNELQRRTTSPECAARYFEATGNVDVVELLGKVTTPTLVMHVRDDARVPFDAGRSMAAGIPGARFIALQGQNHLFQVHEPASERFFEEIKLFLGR